MVSGANRGIGLAIARALAEAGYRLSLGVRRPQDMKEDIARRERLVFAYDAARREDARAWVDATIEAHGRIDVLVNNAGISDFLGLDADGQPDDEAEEILDRLLDINVKGPLRLGRAALAASLRQRAGGRIVTLASLSGKRIKSADLGLYALSKFATVALAHAFRHAGFDQGVRSTAICPGFVATDMARALTGMDPRAMTQPEDLARIVRMCDRAAQHRPASPSCRSTACSTISLHGAPRGPRRRSPSRATTSSPRAPTSWSSAAASSAPRPPSASPSAGVSVALCEKGRHRRRAVEPQLGLVPQACATRSRSRSRSRPCACGAGMNARGRGRDRLPRGRHPVCRRHARRGSPSSSAWLADARAYQLDTRPGRRATELAALLPGATQPAKGGSTPRATAAPSRRRRRLRSPLPRAARAPRC